MLVICSVEFQIVWLLVLAPVVLGNDKGDIIITIVYLLCLCKWT